MKKTIAFALTMIITIVVGIMFFAQNDAQARLVVYPPMEMVEFWTFIVVFVLPPIGILIYFFYGRKRWL